MGKQSNASTKSPAAKTAIQPTADPRGAGDGENTSSLPAGLPRPTKTPTGEDTPVRPSRKEEMVSVTVPRGYNLTLDNGDTKRYESGIQDMPRSHAEHWYSKAHDVELND